jgi:adenylosuccinate lyase
MIHQSLIYQDKFGTPEMRSVWTEEKMLQGWLDLEAAVTGAQGDMGVVPKSIANKIIRNCNTKKITPKAVSAWHNKTGHVIVSLVKTFRDVVPDAGERFHLGITGLTLQIRNALQILIPSLFELEETLLKLARKHRTTVMAGRSEGQQGAPITFGYKIAVMADTIGAHIERLSMCAEPLMILTLFGATGVQSSYALVVGQKRVDRLTELVGKRLGLVVPPICPHKRIDRFVELGNITAMICTTLGEMGMETRDLQRNEVSEVSEPWGDTQFSSSTPQKQNPEPSEWLTGLARLARGFSASLSEIQT